MRASVFTSILLFFINSLFGQKPNSQIEVNPFIRWDEYPKFTYATNPVNYNTVKINGTSFGINASYKVPLHNKFYVIAGLGYYKYAFNKIDQINSLFSGSHGDNRIIEDYTPPGNTTPSITFTTNKYWYNTVALNIGVEKHLAIKRNIVVVFGACLINYFTFSQNYRINYPSPNGTNYKLTNIRYLGLGGKINIGLLKRFGKTNLGPMFILPIYDSWRQDEVFPQEQNSMSRNKWLRGFGVGISCNYTLSKK